jgi:hypothetical protein
MHMALTPAQLDTLQDMARHRGRASRVGDVRTAEWTWNVGGKPRSGTVDRLLRAGYVKAVSSDTLELSDKGWRAIESSSHNEAVHLRSGRHFAPHAAASVSSAS